MIAPGRNGSAVRAISGRAGACMPESAPPPAHFEERHYSVAEIGELWNLSGDVIRKLFEHEPGVMVKGELAHRGKRRYTTLRIPQSVVERVHRRLCNP